MTRDTGKEGCSDPQKSSAVCSQTTSPTTVSTATTPPTETGGAKSRLFATIRNEESEYDSQFFMAPMQPLSATIRNEESDNDSLSFMTPSQPLHDKLDELEERWSNGRPSADTPEHFVFAAGGRMLHRPSRPHAVSLPRPSSVGSEQLTPAKKKAVEIIGTPDEFQGKREQTSVFDRLYQEGKTKSASRQRAAKRGGRNFHSLPSPRTPQSVSMEGTVSTMSSGSVFDRLYKNEKRNKGNVSRISRPPSLSCRDTYQADSASAASSLERRLAYTPPTARRRNHASGPRKVAYSTHGLQPSVDERRAASSTDSVFERLYRGEKRKTPVKAVNSTVRTLKTKRDPAKALPSDSSPSRMSPQKGTVASSDSVFERLYRREKRQTSLLPHKSRIRDRTPCVGSEASPKRDLEIIRSQSVAGTSPCPRGEDGRKGQSLIEKCLLFSEDSDEFCRRDDLPAPTALCYANFPFDAKAYLVKISKNVVTSGTGRAPDESAILNVSQDLQCRVAGDVLARLQLQICARHIQRCARAYIARMSFRTVYKSEFSALASPSSCSPGARELHPFKEKKQVPDMSTVLELHYQEQYLTPTSLERRSATGLQRAWRCHRSQIQVADALLKSWRLNCEFESKITDNRILLMKVRLHTLAKAVGLVDCWWITENVRLEDDLVHVKWEREVGVHFTDRGVPKLESCIISLNCEANHSSFTDKWSRRKLAILIVKAGLERHLICDRAGLLKESATVIQTWIHMKKMRIAFIWKVDSCRIIQRFFRGTCRYKLDQKKDAAEQSEARTTSKVSLTDHVTHGKLIDLICCHDESEECAETDIQSHVRRFRIVRRVRTCDQASRSIQCFARRYRGIRSAQSRRAAAVLIQASVRPFYQRLKSDINQKSAMKIQSVWRAIATRRSFLELRTSAISIQAIERRRQCFILSITLRKANVCELKRRVTMIQSVHRGARIRDQLAKQGKSATKIQCAFRRHEATWSLHTAYAGVVALQAAHRGIKARRLIVLWHTLVARARLALLVQTMWRGSRIRAQHALLHVSATDIQSAYRRHSALRFFRTLITGIITLQKVYRRVRSCRVYVRAKSSVKLQKVLRESRRRVMVVSLLEKIQSERMAKEESAAAAAIQHWYRCRELRLDFVALRQAAVVIQTFERRRKCLSSNAKQSFAAVRIQAAWKGDRIRTMLSLARENAQMLQKRAMVAGVVALQHVARAWLEKKVMAVVTIESFYRKHSLHEEFLSKEQSATRIQTEERRRQYAAKYARALRGTLLLQAHYRGFWTRRVLLRQTEMEKAAAAVIQAYYRGLFLRQRFLTLKLSAVRTQRCLQYTAMDTRVLRSTIRLQAHFRGFLTRWILSRRAETEEAATVVIQSFYRSAVLRQNFLMLKQIVVRIQAVERHRQCMIKYARLRRGVICAQGLHCAFTARRMLPRLAETDEKKEVGAVVVQAYYRGFSLRQHFLTLREIAVRIQAAERRRQHRANYYLAVRGAIRLQVHHRGFPTRRMLTRRVKVEEGSAVVIQTFYRGSFLRQQLLAVKQVNIQIQAAERRRQSLSSNNSALCGTVRPQAIHRGFLTRLMFTRSAEVEEAAAVVIQAYYRGLFLHQKFLAVRQAAIRIQAANRRRHSLSSFGLIRGETVRLQALHRGFLTRRMLARHGEAAYAAAVIIQSFFRGLYLRQHFLTLKESAVRIQNAYRRRQHSANSSLAIRGTIRLQAHHRSLLNRRLLMRRARTEEAVVIAIQIFFRRFFLRQKFLQVKQAAIRIQASSRRRHSLRNYSVVHFGTVRLQALHRGFLTRQMLARRAKKEEKAAVIMQTYYRRLSQLARRAEVEEKAAVIMQTYYRRLSQRLQFVTLTQSFVRIQGAERRQQHRANYFLAVRGTVRLQAHQRGFLTRRMSARRVEAEEAATIVIQTFYRGFFLRQKFFALEQVAIQIQAAVRRRQNLSNYSLVLYGMVRLQALHRGFLTRLGLARRAEMKEAAAVTIQSYRKSFACRQALTMCRRAAVRIQALERRRLSLSKYAVTLVGIVRLQAQYRGLQIRRLMTEPAAAVLIQSCYREFVSRQFFLTCRAVVVRVQTMSRRRHRLSQYWSITHGMVLLQALYRGFSVKRWLRLQEKAARIIQVCWRVALEARRFCDPVHSGAAKRIQVAYFTWKMRATLLMVESSVVFLQRSVRGQLRRSAARFALSHINVSFRSTTLVSFARITNNLDSSVISINHAWSKAVVLAREAACTVTQSAARRMLAILYTADLRKRSGLPALRQFVNRNAASAFMPIKSISSSVSSEGRRKGQRGATKHCGGRLSSARGVRKKPADVVSEPERRVYRYCSAQVIQRAFRTHSKRSSIRVHHAAARQLQKFYRQRSAMAQYAISRKGALCLQSQFRGACVRSEVAAMKSAVVRLQQMRRTHVGYRTIRDATLLIQQAFRLHSKRTTMRFNHVTACHLQKFYRQRWAMARYVIIRTGVICLQSQFRGACVRSEVAAMTSAVVRLQQMRRIHRMGIRYCTVWDATLLIQANYRMRAASRAFDFHRNAAVAIQTLYRSWHGRKTSFHQRIYQEHLQLRLEKSIKSQANDSSRKVVNGILDGNEASAGICVGRLAQRYLSVAEKSKSMIAIASAQKQKDRRLSEYSSRPRNATVDVNAGADDVVMDECIEVAAGRAAAAIKDAATSSRDKVNRLDTQLGTASKAKAPSVPPAASRLAVDEPKKQVDRETETRERPTSPSTPQLAMEAQQLLREARHARARFQKTRSTAPTSKKCTTLSRNDQTHESAPPFQVNESCRGPTGVGTLIAHQTKIRCLGMD